VTQLSLFPNPSFNGRTVFPSFSPIQQKESARLRHPPLFPPFLLRISASAHPCLCFPFLCVEGRKLCAPPLLFLSFPFLYIFVVFPYWKRVSFDIFPSFLRLVKCCGSRFFSFSFSGFTTPPIFCELPSDGNRCASFSSLSTPFSSSEVRVRTPPSLSPSLVGDEIKISLFLFFALAFFSETAPMRRTFLSGKKIVITLPPVFSLSPLRFLSYPERPRFFLINWGGNLSLFFPSFLSTDFF